MLFEYRNPFDRRLERARGGEEYYYSAGLPLFTHSAHYEVVNLDNEYCPI